MSAFSRVLLFLAKTLAGHELHDWCRRPRRIFGGIHGPAMGKNNEDLFNNNGYALAFDHGKDDVAHRQNNATHPKYGGSNGAQSDDQYDFDDVIEQLFEKQFRVPDSSKWKLPEIDTMFVHAKWEVSASLSFVFYVPPVRSTIGYIVTRGTRRQALLASGRSTRLKEENNRPRRFTFYLVRKQNVGASHPFASSQLFHYMHCTTFL